VDGCPDGYREQGAGDMKKIPIQEQAYNKEQEQDSTIFDSFLHERACPYIRRIT